MLPPRLFVYVAVHRNETQAFEKYSESYRNMQHGNRLRQSLAPSSITYVA
jgi:hypothetical protein